MRLGIEDLDLILKERRLRWYGHVERSSGAVKTAFDIQVDGKCGPGSSIPIHVLQCVIHVENLP